MLHHKKIIIVFAIIFALIIGTILFLNKYTFQESVLRFLSENDQVVMELLQSRIEYSLSMGKGLDQFYGMEEILSKFSSKYNFSDNVLVVDEEWNLIEGSNKLFYEFLTDSRMEQLLKQNNVFKQELIDGCFVSATKLYDSNKSCVGYLININNGDKYQDSVKAYMNNVGMIYGFFVFLVIVVSLLTRNRFITFFISNREQWIKKLIIFCVITQVLISIPGFYFFYNGISQMVYSGITNTLSIIEGELQVITDNHVSLDDINGLDSYLQERADKISAVESITADDSSGEIKLSYTFSREYMNQIIKSNLLGMGSILIISIFILMESIQLAGSLINGNKDEKGQILHRPELIRGQAFFLFLAYYTSFFFVPIRMMQLVEGAYSFLPRQTFLGLPTSMEALAIAITAIAVASIVDRRGCRKVFTVGNLTMFTGFFLSFISVNPYIFILSRIVTGVGYGASLTSLRTYVTYADKTDEIGTGIAAVNAGAYSGLNIGSIIGGMIGNYIGLKYNFIISMALIYISGYLSYSLIGNSKWSYSNRFTFSLFKDIFSLLKEKKLILSLFMILFPITIMVSFIDYFYPLYAVEKLKWSLIGVSRGYLINGLIIVLFGMVINDYMVKRYSVLKRILIGTLTNTIGLLMFAFFRNNESIYIAIVFLSVSMSYLLGAFIEHYTSFPSIKNLGLAKAMSIYTLFEKLYYYIVPFIYGLILAMNQIWIMISITIMLFTLVAIYCVYFRRNGNGWKNSGSFLKF